MMGNQMQSNLYIQEEREELFSRIIREIIDYCIMNTHSTEKSTIGNSEIRKVLGWKPPFTM